MVKPVTSTLWQYFDKIPDKTEATCKFCKKLYSYKTSITNLKRHLNSKHVGVYQEWGDNELTPSRVKVENPVKQSVRRETKSPNDDENSLLKRRIRRPRSSEDSTDSETEKADDEFFTEVVYLDDEKPKRAPKGVSRVLTKAQTRKRFSRQPIKVERMDFRNSSISSDESSPAPKKIIEFSPKRPRTTTPADPGTTDELDSFLVYIKSLLRTVPKESSTRLQMEIINLIMAEKFRQTAGQSTSSLDPEIVDVKPTSASSREVTEGTLTLKVFEA